MYPGNNEQPSAMSGLIYPWVPLAPSEMTTDDDLVTSPLQSASPHVGGSTAYHELVMQTEGQGPYWPTKNVLGATEEHSFALIQTMEPCSLQQDVVQYQSRLKLFDPQHNVVQYQSRVELQDQDQGSGQYQVHADSPDKQQGVVQHQSPAE